MFAFCVEQSMLTYGIQILLALLLSSYLLSLKNKTTANPSLFGFALSLAVGVSFYAVIQHGQGGFELVIMLQLLFFLLTLGERVLLLHQEKQQAQTVGQESGLFGTKDTALREQEELFRGMFENYSAVMLLVNPENGQIVEANHAAVHYYGYSLPELKKLSIHEINQLSPAEVQQEMLWAKTEKHKYFEFLHRLAHGEIRTVEVYSSPVTFKDQTLLFSIVHDITERKQAEEAVRESETRFKVISTSAQDAIIMIDEQGHISFWNEAASRIFGYTAAEMLKQSLHTLMIHPFYLIANQDQIKQWQGKVAGKTFELEARRKSGEVFPIEISLSAFQLKGQWHALGILHDITERKQLEAELQQLAAQQVVILEGSIVGIVLVKERVIVWANKRFAEMFGYTLAEVTGFATKGFYHSPEEYEQLGQEAYPQLLLGQAYHSEWQLRQRDGTPLWCSLNAKAVDPTATTLGTIWLLEDITERKAQEAILRKYERIVTATTDQIALIDRAYCYQMVNAARSFARGSAKDELVGHPLSEIWGLESFQTAIKSTFDQCLAGQILHQQAWFTYKGVGRRFMDVTYVPYLEPDHTISGVVMNARDITEFKEIEQQLQKANNHFRAELAFARTIQQNLLQYPYPPWSEIKVFCFNMPAREVGGDFYNYLAFPASAGAAKYLFAVGDVTGKGMPAALFMAVSIALLRSLAPKEFSPSLLLTNLDKQLENYTKEDRMNCALCCIEITLSATRTERALARIANGGLIPPFLKPCEGQAELLDVAGPPLGTGFGAMLGYPEELIELSPGDMLILTSDGLVEAMNPQGELLGFERTLAMIQAGPPDAEGMLAHLQAEVLAFTGGAEPHDDITIVIVQF